MSTHHEYIEIRTSGKKIMDLTAEVGKIVRNSGISDGLCHIFIRHTSASLLISENADPDVKIDLLHFFDRLAPENFRYVHSDEGPDDMPAHIKAAILPTSLTVPVISGKLALGTWQGILLCEHRDRPHRRSVVVTVTGD